MKICKKYGIPKKEIYTRAGVKAPTFDRFLANKPVRYYNTIKILKAIQELENEIKQVTK